MPHLVKGAHQDKLSDNSLVRLHRESSLTEYACWPAQAKQTSYEELSAGQASQMARNETEIDRATEEMEDLEETLNESIAESIKSRQRQVCYTFPCPHGAPRVVSHFTILVESASSEPICAQILHQIPWALQLPLDRLLHPIR